MRELARQAGVDVCREDILSLSVGKALYPEDGTEAERLLAEADRRMYLQKQSQAGHKNRRLYPRAKGRLTTEIAQVGQDAPGLGIVNNLSMGGCYVETSTVLLPGSEVKLTFSVEHAAAAILADVIRMDMGIGVALRFRAESAESRASLERILEQFAKTEGVAQKQASQSFSAGQKH
jgi:hypothetical protein